MEELAQDVDATCTGRPGSVAAYKIVEEAPAMSRETMRADDSMNWTPASQCYKHIGLRYWMQAEKNKDARQYNCRER